MFRAICFFVLLVPLACTVTPEVRSPGFFPAMQWDHHPEASGWTQATLDALKAEGAILTSTIPSDVATFCPGYAEASISDRQAFWAGLLSAVARYESAWNPAASGGGGRWLGLMQISPETARANGCVFPEGAGLQDGASNLVCAVRIAARQVAADGAIATTVTGGWGGLARDWLPLREPEKRAQVAGWTSKQSYCGKPA